MAVVYSSFLFIAGVYFVGLSIYGHLRFRSAKLRAQPVTLRVVDIAKDYESEENTLFTPTFEIIEGANKGAVVTGSTCSDGHHKPGEVIDGLYDPETDTAVSAKDLDLMKWMPKWTAFFGIAFLCICVYGLF